MRWTKEENDRRRATRIRLLLSKEHTVNPIRYWGTLHISRDYDMAKLRRGLSLAQGRGDIPPVFVKIERTKRAARSHFHFVWHDDPAKKILRSVLVKLLAEQDVPSRAIRLSVGKIANVKAVFPYVAKASSNFASEKRTTFTVGGFFHKPTKDICRKTPKQIWNSKIDYIAHDPLTLDCILRGVVKRTDLANPRWLSYWKRVGRSLHSRISSGTERG